MYMSKHSHVCLCSCSCAVLAYLFGLKHLDLDDLSKPGGTAVSTVLNYVHAIHMEVSALSIPHSHASTHNSTWALTVHVRHPMCVRCKE
jgi:hypothetical protein